MRIGIIGLGLIGGSLGAALRRAGHDVSGFDVDRGATRVACERGLVGHTARSLAEVVGGCDVVVLATPVETTVDLLDEMHALLTDEAIVTDVASVKRDVIAAMDRLPAWCRAVGGHPIAGSERSGAEAADADLFRGAAYAIVPSERSDAEAQATVAALTRVVGAIPHTIDAVTHDAMLARTSHLPQLLASTLALLLTRNESLDGAAALSGSGLRDMTRLAASDPDLWTQIFAHNADNVGRAGRAFVAELLDFIEAIESGDALRVRGALCAAREGIGPLRSFMPASDRVAVR